MKDDLYINNLSVRLFIDALFGKVFHLNLQSLICMETPCWCPFRWAQQPKTEKRKKETSLNQWVLPSKQWS